MHVGRMGRIVIVATLFSLAAGCAQETPRHRKPRAEREPPAAGSAVTQAKSADAAGSPAAVSVAGWGTIKGRITWSGATPAVKTLDVQKDTEWCLGAGPLKDEDLVVDEKTKGIRDVFVYLRDPPAVHPDMPQNKDQALKAYLAEFEKNNGFTFDKLGSLLEQKKVDLRKLKAPGIVDQVRCAYVPHAIGVIEGAKTLVLNPEPITHNVKVTSVSGKNDANPNMPPSTFVEMEWAAERQPLSVQCSIHGWMSMRAMAFKHPYFRVTKEDGAFELKNVPAGDSVLIVRGNVEFARGKKVTVKPDETVDLGELQWDGQTEIR